MIQRCPRKEWSLMLKKTLAGILSATLVFLTTMQVFAEDTVPTAAPAPLSQNAVVMEYSTGKLLYAVNETQQRAPASVTKIMTMCLAFEQIQSGKLTMDTMITASENAKNMGGTQINLDVGEQMKVYDLLMAVAVCSANDAAIALAEHIGGSESGFVTMMNAKAKELYMDNTNFMNPHGLPADGHVTCAQDIALMTKYLLSFEQSKEFIGTKIHAIREGENEYKMRNTNNLLWTYNGCIGGKTGYTEDAGYCMSIAAQRDGMTAIAVVMGEATSKDRTIDIEALLDYAFNNFTLWNVPVEPVALSPIPVKFGIKSHANITTTQMLVPSQVIPKGTTPTITQEVELSPSVTAPVNDNQSVGKVKVLMDGTVISEFDITADKAVARRDFPRSLAMLIKNLVTM